MKKIITALSIGLLACSCDFHLLFRELDAYFLFYNVGKSDYSRIVVYAKDSSNTYIDSTSALDNVKRARTGTLAISVQNFRDIRNGVFEIQANMENGKLLRQEFGSIDGLDTKLKFKIHLKDSTIFIK
jgi:hypothetical protein